MDHIVMLREQINPYDRKFEDDVRAARMHVTTFKAGITLTVIDPETNVMLFIGQIAVDQNGAISGDNLDGGTTKSVCSDSFLSVAFGMHIHNILSAALEILMPSKSLIGEFDFHYPVFLLDTYDPENGKEQAEDALSLPVVEEVPFISTK